MATRLAAPLPSVMGAGVALAEVEALGAGLCILAGLGGLGAACGQGEGGYCAECAGAGEEKLTGHVHAPRLT